MRAGNEKTRRRCADQEAQVDDVIKAMGRWVMGWGVVRSVCVLAAVGRLAATAGPAAAQPKLKPVGFAMPTTPPNLVHIPVWVAQDTGIFAKYGIEVKIFTFEGGPSALRALIGGGGQINVAAPGIPPFVAALAQGAELKAIGTYAVRH